MKACAQIARTPNKALARQIVDGTAVSHSFLNLPEFAALSRKEPRDWLFQFRKFYLWQRPLAKAVLGSPDAIFAGEFQYAIYIMEARVGDKVQQFVLWSDPKSAGKGSTIELLSPFHAETVIPIIKELHRLNPG
jgi:hypothetical protein